MDVLDSAFPAMFESDARPAFFFGRPHNGANHRVQSRAIAPTRKHSDTFHGRNSFFGLLVCK
jgi:hypothetical protein